MGTALRKLPQPKRIGERIPFHARLRISTSNLESVTPLARCTHLSLGGIRVMANIPLAPRTVVDIAFRLPSGRLFQSHGHVAWSHETVRLALFGATAEHEDDAVFGIVFDHPSPEDLLPIARLLTAKDAETRRARRIRRIHGLPNCG